MKGVTKVLVATCTYSGKHYAFKKWWDGIMNLNYPISKILIVDNSGDGGKYAHKLRRIVGNKAKVITTPRLDNTRDTLSASQNIIRQFMLDGDYDYWMSIESDVVAPPNTVETLLNEYKPVVSGLYEIGSPNGGLRRYCVFREDKKENGMNGTRLITQEEHNYLKNNEGLIVKVAGCGIGCVLLRRDIVERFPFWTDTRFTNKHSDVYFYMDLWNNNIPVYVTTSIKCEHYNSDWSLIEDR